MWLRISKEQWKFKHFLIVKWALCAEVTFASAGVWWGKVPMFVGCCSRDIIVLAERGKRWRRDSIAPNQLLWKFIESMLFSYIFLWNFSKHYLLLSWQVCLSSTYKSNVCAKPTFIKVSVCVSSTYEINVCLLQKKCACVCVCVCVCVRVCHLPLKCVCVQCELLS